MRHALPASAALLLLAAGAARAQEGPAPAPAPSPERAAAPDVAGASAANAAADVVVVANRRPEALDRVGQSVTVLTLPQIRADQELVVSDILARTPGVNVSRNGGPGQVTALRIRGAETDQTAVLIDGVKLDDPSSPGGGYNFADLVTGDISRIEVLRGPQSTLYGSPAIGGVVNIVTADPTRPLEGDAQAEGGSYATGYAKAGIGGRQGPLTFRAAASTYTTDGVSAFDSRRGGREDDGYQNTTLTARLGYALAASAALDLRAYYVDAKNQFDGYSTPTFSFGDDPEFGRTREFVGYSGLNFGLLDGRLRNRLAAGYTLTQRESYDPTNPGLDKTFDGRGINVREEYQGGLDLAPGYSLTFGAEHDRASITTSSPAYSAPGAAPLKAHVDITSGYGQLQGEVVRGLNLTGGVRYDDHSTFGGHATGQAAAAWSLFGGGTVLRASWGQGFKAPTLYQLYSEYGNTALDPERSHGWDAGVEQRFWDGRGSVQATWFDRDTRDLITFVSCPFSGPRTGLCLSRPGAFGYYANVARSAAQGVELSGELRPLQALELAANYTYTDARDRSAGSATFDRLLSRRPQDAANFSGTYTWPVRLSTTLAVRYTGRSFDDAANTTLVKGYTLFDVRAAYPVTPHLELYGRVENLFDRAYETTYAFGALGRAAYAGVRASF